MMNTYPASKEATAPSAAALRMFRNPPDQQRGAITVFLTVIILFLMALVAIAAHRSMSLEHDIFESFYASILAQHAADAGLDLTAARLGQSSERALIFTSDGATYTGFSDGQNGVTHEHLSEITTFGEFDNSGNFPGGSIPGQISASVRIAPWPETYDENDSSFDVMRIIVESRGCWWLHSEHESACSPCSSSCATSTQTSNVFLFRGALTGVPTAPLTAKGNVDLGSNAITIENTDSTTAGLTIHSGGNISPHSNANIETLPGTPPEASIAGDDDSIGSNISTDDFFSNLFGISKDDFRNSASLVISCSNCNDKVDGKEGKTIWIEPGNDAAVLNADVTVGSPDNPVIMVVAGELELRGTVTIYGLVYSAHTFWDNTGGGTAKIYGAAVSEGDFEATGTPNPVYDGEILNKLSGQVGRFNRVPGTWRDF